MTLDRVDLEAASKPNEYDGLPWHRAAWAKKYAAPLLAEVAALRALVAAGRSPVHC